MNLIFNNLIYLINLPKFFLMRDEYDKFKAKKYEEKVTGYM